MKKVLLGLFFALAMFSFASPVFAESIKNFDAVYDLPQSGVIEVAETIEYDFGSEYRHGIYRFIPYKYIYENGESVYINISQVSVKDESGSKYQYEKYNSNGNVVLKIGDPDRTITGEHTYVIEYTVKGGLRYLESGDEFFWNVNGTGWDVPAESVTATVNFPETVSSIDTACWSGPHGSESECENTSSTVGSVVFSETSLRANEGLSFDVGVPAGTFEVVSAGFLGSGVSENIVGMLVIVACGIPLLVFIFMLRHWWRKGRDPKGRGTIVAEYDPPNGLTPIEVGTLLDNRVDNKDLSAQIIYLATQGYLKIEKGKKKFLSGSDYTLVKTKEAKGLVNAFDISLYSGIFGSGDVVKMSNLKEDFYTHISSIKANVHNKIVKDGYFKAKVANTIGKYLAIAGVFAFLGIGVGSILGAFTNGVLAFIFIPSAVVSAIIIAGFGLLMPARTLKGVEVKEHILGLKEYMKVAESDRIKFHNAPDKTPEKFEQLLPYAMVLGVEKEWAKQFEGIYKGQPDWYSDPTGARFTPILFASSMSNFSSAVTTNMTTPPASSGSGLSGGGFSGGGFGGGGGGSW